MDIKAIIKYLDNFLTQTGRSSIEPVESNAILAKAGLLPDSELRPAKPLRGLLREGQLPHAFQSGGKGTGWTIPHSSKQTRVSSISPTSILQSQKTILVKSKLKTSESVNFNKLKIKLEKARLKYKPNIVKYLLVAEAPPESIERFFYYEDVHQHDYLFLGVAQALYPELKNKFIASKRNSVIKNSILLKFKAEGFYLLDLSELPLSLLKSDLSSQSPILAEKIKKIANVKTKIILIKATVFDTAFNFLQNEKIKNIVNIRIPFPGQGGQKQFQIKFAEALKLVGYKNIKE